MEYLKYIYYALIFISVLLAYLCYINIKEFNNQNNLGQYKENYPKIKKYNDNRIKNSIELALRKKNNDFQKEVKLEVKSFNETNNNNINIINEKEKEQYIIPNKSKTNIQKFIGSISNFFRITSEKFLSKLICKSQKKSDYFMELNKISLPRDEESHLVINDIENNQILFSQNNSYYNNQDIIRENISMNNRNLKQTIEDDLFRDEDIFITSRKDINPKKDGFKSLVDPSSIVINPNYKIKSSFPNKIKENQSPNKMNK
jgi:hypothetical protein